MRLADRSVFVVGMQLIKDTFSVARKYTKIHGLVNFYK